MKIWVDADACPKVIKEILFRVAKRKSLMVTMVSNHSIPIPPSPYITKLLVPSGFDVADDKIVQSIQKGDLVITADIPLADAVVTKGAHALNPRGELYTEANIKQRLSIRNFSDGLRSSGVITGGPAKISKKEIQDFANALDKLVC